MARQENDPLAKRLEWATASYLLVYEVNARSGLAELVLHSRTDGKHRASHTSYNLLDADGKVVEKQPITPDVAQFIMANFEQRGDTESFNIYAEDLAAGRLRHRGEEARIAPADVRHAMTGEENSFTATGAKLAAHWPIFEKYRDTGFGSIIRATMTNHQVCSSRCQFCSTIARNKRDSISLDEAKAFVETLYTRQAEFNREHFPEHSRRYRELTGSDIRLRGLILSGGGQPNLWPHFAEFVEWLGGLDIDLGLITNGFPPKVPQEVYTHFKWVRLSITPANASPFYPEGRFEDQYIPATLRHNPDVTVGLSYVFGPWAEDDILGRIDSMLRACGFDYARLLTDCNLTRDSQLLAHRDLADRLFREGHIGADGQPTGKLFQQFKYHGTPGEAEELWDSGQCYLQSYNVFWDTTGHEEQGHSHCYPCDSVTVLAEEETSGHVSMSERKFNPSKWGTVSNTEVHRLFTERVHPFFDPRKHCTSCLFMRNNRSVKDLSQREGYADIIADNGLKHVNFP
jgi:hypothetical protein